MFHLWQNNCWTSENNCMKLLMTSILLGCMLAGCGGANDGDAATDTTSTPLDTNIHSNTSDHINRADGTISVDSAGKDSVRKQY